jgi:hypothetical protein
MNPFNDMTPEQKTALNQAFLAMLTRLDKLEEALKKC